MKRWGLLDGYEKIIIRIVPNKFILLNWSDFIPFLENPKTDKKGLSAWEFIIINNFTKIQNKKSKKEFPVQCLSIEEMGKVVL